MKEFELRYSQILDIAKDEYENEPPSKYNKDGFNLYQRMQKHKSNHLLFLHDRLVPFTNNLAERLLRSLKRKAHQVMCFRSFGGIDKLCECLGTIEMMRAKENNNVFEGMSKLFDRILD